MFLERDVVVAVSDRAVVLAGLLLVIAGSRWALLVILRLGLIVAAAIAALVLVDEVEPESTHLQLATLLAGVLVLPLLQAKLTLAEDLPSLGEVFSDRLAGATEVGDIDEAGLLLALSRVLVGPLLG